MAYARAMLRNVRMLEIPCPPELTAEAELTFCAAPYWKFREFRQRWDDDAMKAASVPSIPASLSDWKTVSGGYERTYSVDGHRLRVVFDRKTGGVAVRVSRDPMETAATNSASASPTPASPASSASLPPAPMPIPPANDRSQREGLVEIAVTSPAERAAGSPSPSSPVQEPPRSPDASPDAASEDEIQPPRVLRSYRAAPNYPSPARDFGLSARVEVGIRVGANGRVIEAWVVRCDRPGFRFEDEALKAVRRWRFAPALRAGVPVEATAVAEIVFSSPR